MAWSRPGVVQHSATLGTASSGLDAQSQGTAEACERLKADEGPSDAQVLAVMAGFCTNACSLILRVGMAGRGGCTAVSEGISKSCRATSVSFKVCF